MVNTFAALPVVSDTDVPAMVQRLESIFLSGSPALVLAGSQWYAERHRDLDELSALSGIPTVVLAYVASALSPQTQWRLNKEALFTMVTAWVRGQEMPRTATLYATNDIKAWVILNDWTNMVALLGQGPKTHAFARNLTECETLHDGRVAVTIDSITYQAATGIVPKNSIRGKRYQRVADAVRILANKYGVAIYVMQAVLWCVFRGTGA